jgi:hypothetical protein
MDAYDTIKKYYIEGFPQSDLKKFMGEINYDDFKSGVFRDEHDDDDTIGESLKKMFCFCRRDTNDTVNSSSGYTTLHPKPSVSSYE